MAGVKPMCLNDDSLDGSPKPDHTKHLFLLLTKISSRWPDIGEKLKCPEEVEKIKYDLNTCNCDRQMIELLGRWNLQSNCNWPAIIKALDELGEKVLSLNILHYIKEIERIEKVEMIIKKDERIEKLGFNPYRMFAPLIDQCHEEIELTKWCFKRVKLVRGLIDDSRSEVITCLQKINTRWYEMGIIMGLPKPTLDAIEMQHKYNPSTALGKMISALIDIQSYNCTWKLIIDALLEMNCEVVAKSVIELAQKYYGCKYDMTVADVNQFRMSGKNFEMISYEEEEIQKCVSKVRDILHLPSPLYVTDQEIEKNLSKYIAVKKLSPKEMESVIKFAGDMGSLSLKHAKNLTEKAGELIADFEKVEGDLKKLEEGKRELEFNKGKLEFNMVKINKKIESFNDSNDKSKKDELLNLQAQNQSMMQELKDADEQLKKCIQQLMDTNADHRFIQDELNICRNKLYNSEWELTACYDIVADNSSSFTRLFKKAIEDTLKEIKTTTTKIEETQKAVHLKKKEKKNEIIRIFVLILSGKTIEFYVKASSTIGDLKSQIESKEDYLVGEQLLYFNGVYLQDEQTLSECSIQDDATIHLLLRCCMQFFVKSLEGETYTLETKSSDTIQLVTLILEDKIGTRVHQQNRKSFEKQLGDRCTLSSYDIQKGSKLHLVLKIH